MKYLLFLFSIACLSFETLNPCIIEVKQVFDKLNQYSSDKKVSYINYTVTSTLKEKDSGGKNIVNSGVFEMLSTSKQNRIFSKEMIVLKDQLNTITILPSRKTIYISDAVIGKKNENLYGKLRLLQDTIFKNASEIECVEAKNKIYNKIVGVVLNSKMSQILEIKKASYYINSDDKTLKKVIVEYLPNKHFVQLDYVFNETNFDYKKIDMTISVEKLIFETGKKLKKEYQGYKVIDNRNK